MIRGPITLRTDERRRWRGGALRVIGRGGNDASTDPLDGPPPSTPAGFQVIAHHWIVERSHSWVGRRRRLSSDFERRPDTSAEWYGHAWSFTMTAQLTG